MEPRKLEPRILLSLVPGWEIVLLLSNLSVMLGVLRFWGHAPDWMNLTAAALSGIGFYGAIRLTRRILPLRNGRIHPASGQVRRLAAAFGELHEFPIRAFIDNALYLALFFFLIGVYGYFLFFTRSGDRVQPLIWLGLMISLALVDLYRAANEVFSWTREILDGFFIFVMPTLFLIMSQDGSLARTTILALLSANLLFYFSDRFIKTMADCDCGVTFLDGLFVTMIRRQRFHAYGFFVALAYLAIVIFNLTGVQWRLLSPILFGLPLFAAVIVILERIERGGVYQRKPIGVLAAAALFFVLYAEMITIWIFA